MIWISFQALAAVTATVLIHAFGTAWWIVRLRTRREAAPQGLRVQVVLGVLVKTTLVLIALHTLEVCLWAIVLHQVPGGGVGSMEEAIYLSFTTFTTLGYGDVTLSGPWRILSGIESLNGVILLGWSTALSFVVLQKAWEARDRQDEGGDSRSIPKR